jgi:4-amino-4-deoxy-L-arabinose transferase
MILSTIGIWITFSIGLRLFNHRVGYIAAFLYSIHGLIIEITAGRVATDHIDVFFLVFIELAVLMAIRFAESRKVLFNLLCGIFTGAAILSKWLPALIVIPIWLSLVLSSRKFNLKQALIGLFILGVSLTAVFLPWQLCIKSIFPMEARWEYYYNRLHFTSVLEGHVGPFYYHFNQARILFGELIYLPMIWFIWKAIKKPGNSGRLSILIWFMIPFVFFSFAQTKMQGYTLFTAPAIFIISALFWHYLYQLRNRFRYRWIAYAVLFLIIALPVRYSTERIKPFEKRDRNPAWARELKTLEIIGDKTVIFNTEHPIEAMFYQDCVAYPGIPDSPAIEKIEGAGYHVLILGDQQPRAK